jgi:2-iminoacetate synthase
MNRFDSFLDEISQWPPQRVRDAVYGSDPDAVARALSCERPSTADLAALLSPAAEPHLELLARRAEALTRRRFGRAMQFYVPLYVSSYCTNGCTYCGFNCRNRVRRQRLTLDQAEREARYLADEGFQHLLLVSGEDRSGVPVAYFEDLARRLSRCFASLSIEIYPLSSDEYASLARAGVDSLTIYQETYDRERYPAFHPSGSKRDYGSRLDAIERGARAGVTFLGIGALLGLSDWRVDSFYVALHGRYLQRRYWRRHVSVSFPRMRAAAGAMAPEFPVSDQGLVQALCATRLFLPDAGLVMSTRESARFREHVLPLGVTRISAGSRTTPGGYADSGTEAEGQFEVQDHRPLDEVMDAVRRLGFDPVCKDWDRAYH